MLIYEDTKEGFQEDVLNDKILEEIKKGFEEKGLGNSRRNNQKNLQNPHETQNERLLDLLRRLPTTRTY